MKKIKSQIAIIGGGPSGLMLSHMLGLAGIDSIVLETRDPDYVVNRLRAGVLEQTAVDLINQVGLGERMAKIGLKQRCIEFRFDQEARPIDFHDLTEGRCTMVYPQNEVMSDLIEAHKKNQKEIWFHSEVNKINHDFDKPIINFNRHGEEYELTADFVVGCDGFHGISRASMPAEFIGNCDYQYGVAWLGILAQAAPATNHVVYGCHESGFAMMSIRSPEVTRLYLQCDPREDIHQWSDARIWEALHQRLDVPQRLSINEGVILQKTSTVMRSFMVNSMQYKKMFLVGDAAHIVPPPGAKGLNSAFADVAVLFRGLSDFYKRDSEDLLRRYSQIALRRMWLVQRFSNGLCNMIHQYDHHSVFEKKKQLADLRYMTTTEQGRLDFSLNFTGLPINF